MSNPDDMQEGDILYVILTEANKEGGYETETSIPIDFFVESLKKKLFELKKEDTLLLDIEKSFTKIQRSNEGIDKGVLNLYIWECLNKFCDTEKPESLDYIQFDDDKVTLSFRNESTTLDYFYKDRAYSLKSYSMM